MSALPVRQWREAKPICLIRMNMLRYDFSPRVVAFTTTREGGVSLGAYASMNVNPFCGDRPEHVAENRRRLCAALGIASDRLVFPHQTHTSNVRRVDSTTLPDALDDVDAVFTTERNLCIGVSTADCLPLLLCHAEAGVVAAVHAGWRGTAGLIAQATVEAMRDELGVDAAGLRVQMGPCIGLAAFEVGDEVCEQFRQAGFPMERVARRMGPRWHIDLQEANAWALEVAGVRAESIVRNPHCTFTEHGRFFSARRLGIASGRLLSGIMLR